MWSRDAESTRSERQIMTWLYKVAPSAQRRKVWLTPTTAVPRSNAAKTGNPLKLLGCPKLANRSQPLVDRSSPYCDDTWGRYCCLTSFFRLSIYALVAKTYSPTKLCDGAQMADFWRFFWSCISSKPRAAHFRPAF